MELDDIQHDQVLVRIENRILRAFVSSSDFENAADLLLKYLVPNPSRGFAAVFYVDDSQLVLESSRGLSKSSRQELRLDLEGFPQHQQQRDGGPQRAGTAAEANSGPG